MKELELLNLQIRSGFEAALLMSTFLSNEDLAEHIKAIQKEVKKNG